MANPQDNIIENYFDLLEASESWPGTSEAESPPLPSLDWSSSPPPSSPPFSPLPFFPDTCTITSNHLELPSPALPSPAKTKSAHESIAGERKQKKVKREELDTEENWIDNIPINTTLESFAAAHNIGTSYFNTNTTTHTLHFKAVDLMIAVMPKEARAKVNRNTLSVAARRAMQSMVGEEGWAAARGFVSAAQAPAFLWRVACLEWRKHGLDCEVFQELLGIVVGK
ncbi:hypothetical protein HK104_011317 [Borealophlyctis nickersoniae]|nr:hypothetical protein HK104_011317 [Borealophlyctis nickersoniae]